MLRLCIAQDYDITEPLVTSTGIENRREISRKIMDMSIIVAGSIQHNISRLKLGCSFMRSIETLVNKTK